MKTLSVFATAVALAMAATPARAGDTTAFHTPSKNIYCYGEVSGEGTTIDCELLTQTNKKPLRPQPADCDLDWGSRFAVKNDGKATMVCAGDTLRSNEAKNLPYGKRLDFYGIACTATKQGLECINDDAHGFRISKSKQEIY
jgi:hypothetical protein